jgi:hypothetical protein
MNDATNYRLGYQQAQLDILRCLLAGESDYLPGAKVQLMRAVLGTELKGIDALHTSEKLFEPVAPAPAPANFPSSSSSANKALPLASYSSDVALAPCSSGLVDGTGT